ncbi:MAG: oligosaccharide flippase family protein, partial [Steroidobacteraceae bacterium]
MSGDSSATNARHLQRRRVITRTALTGCAAKAAMFLPTLGIAKVAVPVVGAERFGVLMTILSLVAFLGVGDLGVGSSLVTLVSRAIGSQDHARVRRLQANGIIAVSGLAAILFLVAAAVRYTDVGAMMFPLSSASIQREGTLGLSAFGMCFALSLPLTLIGKIQLGLQRGELANYWQIAAAFVNFAAASVATVSGLGIPWITAGMLSGTILCAALNMVTYFIREPRVRPSLRDVSRTEIKELLADSSFYLALQLIFLVAYSADTMIVARVLGAQRASVYALAERLFSMVAVAVGLVT